MVSEAVLPDTEVDVAMRMGETALAIRDIRTQIQAADTSELADINTHLETLEYHARKVKDNTGKLREIVILRIEVLRKLGAELNRLAPHGGARLPGGILTLEKLGISPKLSVKARRLSEIHEEDVRVFIEESGDELNISHLLKLHTESETEPPEKVVEWRTVKSVLDDYKADGGDLDNVRLWLEEASDV